MAKLVIIEDDELMLRMYHRIFTNAGYEVALAETGEIGIGLLDKEKPDLIILDIMMPKKDGIQTLAEIKSNSKYANTPVVMMTNLAEDEAVKRALEGGASGYIVKSQMTNDRLVEEIGSYIRK